MTATMKCPKCKAVATGELAGKVGFSGPRGGPLSTLPPTPVRYRFECRVTNCGHVWYPDASEVDAKSPAVEERSDRS